MHGCIYVCVGVSGLEVSQAFPCQCELSSAAEGQAVEREVSEGCGVEGEGEREGEGGRWEERERERESYIVQLGSQLCITQYCLSVSSSSNIPHYEVWIFVIELNKTL